MAKDKEISLSGMGQIAQALGSTRFNPNEYKEELGQAWKEEKLKQKQLEEIRKKRDQMRRKLVRVDEALADLDANWLKNKHLAICHVPESFFVRYVNCYDNKDILSHEPPPNPHGTQLFIVETDWLQILRKHAPEFNDDAEFHLPFENCCFEFSFSGLPVLMFARQSDDKVIFGSAMRTKVGWIATDMESHFGFYVAATCIAMEAEIARQETVHIPELRNSQATKSSKPVLSAYTIIRPGVRHSYASRGDGSGAQRRLHFRRGHWRRYTEYKIWIKWQLVGNPDLGFVDHDYKV